MKVLNITTYNEECGVAKFQANIQKAFENINEVDSVIFPRSLNYIKKLNAEERLTVINEIVAQANKYDVVHIQHEFGLFFNLGEGFGEIITALKANNTRVVVTIHTAPSHVLIYNPSASLYRPRSVLGHTVRALKNHSQRKKLLEPLKMADAVVTLNRNTKSELVDIVGVSADVILSTIHPVKNEEHSRRDSAPRAFTDKKAVILAVNGFVNPYKGFDKAIKSLMFLPENYKLLIAGGVNPDSGNSKYMDEICDLITKLGLTDRVHITGYVKEDEELERIIGSCDIVLYPYDVDYYKLASSGAVGIAINCELPIVTFPADSFKEIDEYMSGVLEITDSTAYYELAQRAMRVADKPRAHSNIKEFKEKNSYGVFAQKLLDLYQKIS